MSTESDVQGQPSAEEGSLSFLDRAIEATTQTPADTTKELFSVLAEQALSGTVTWDKNLTKTIESAIGEIDKKLSKQLSAVMQQDDFQKLEGSWRGLQKLVKESDTGRSLKIKMVDFSQDELLEQFEDAPAIDRSPFFNALYQDEYGTAGGEPYGTFIGDYEFSAKDEDVALLRYMGEVAAACHAPFIAAANAQMFEFNDFSTFEEGKPV
ncbi:type VI secretion system contractile sheath domain-containing protein, partial [Vibrio mediterranei]